jgi:hypothetical protein
MEGREKPYTDKYKEIMKDLNYDTIRTITSLPVWNLKIFKRMISGAPILGLLVPPGFCNYGYMDAIYVDQMTYIHLIGHTFLLPYVGL